MIIPPMLMDAIGYGLASIVSALAFRISVAIRQKQKAIAADVEENTRICKLILLIHQHQKILDEEFKRDD